MQACAESYAPSRGWAPALNALNFRFCAYGGAHQNNWRRANGTKAYVIENDIINLLIINELRSPLLAWRNPGYH
jgi:hypothetical protein